jgi:pectinesterase
MRAARLIGAGLVVGCASAGHAPTPSSALAAAAAQVDAAFAGADGTRVDGIPTYHTLGAALSAVPSDATTPVVIRLRNGRYREKLSVDKPSISLVGESRDGTVITYDAASDTRDPNGAPYGTRGSFTLRVTAPDFHAEHLTIENAFDYAGNARKPESDPTKFRNTQGVALATTGASDRAVFDDVRLLGHQDTFFGNAGRHYFRRCVIAGHVDFIFGAGTVVFDDCDIVSLDRGSPTDNGYITAPSTDATTPYGMVFYKSRLKKESPSMAPRSVALGRPWHPSATPAAVSSAIYLECWMDDHISPKGWDHMSSVDSATKVRYWFEPGSARFLEYRSTGPGAVESPTRRVMSEGDARTYARTRVLGGWRPELRP